VIDVALIQESPLARPRLQAVTNERDLRSLLESTERLLLLAAPTVARERRLRDARLFAAFMLTDRVEIAEALLAGVDVPADRLNPEWARRLGWAE
jgi:hypothetical protein